MHRLAAMDALDVSVLASVTGGLDGAVLPAPQLSAPIKPVVRPPAQPAARPKLFDGNGKVFDGNGKLFDGNGKWGWLNM